MLVVSVRAQDFSSGPLRPRAVDYVGESAGALAGGGLLSIGVYFATKAIIGYDGGSLWGSFLGAGLGYPFGCALGATLAGGALGVNGNVDGAYEGAFAGMALGATMAMIPSVSDAGLVALAALTPAGAVIGYSIGAARRERDQPFGGRFLPPAVALSSRLAAARQGRTVVDCRLVTMRF